MIISDVVAFWISGSSFEVGTCNFVKKNRWKMELKQIKHSFSFYSKILQIFISVILKNLLVPVYFTTTYKTGVGWSIFISKYLDLIFFKFSPRKVKIESNAQAKKLKDILVDYGCLRHQHTLSTLNIDMPDNFTMLKQTLSRVD